ncbi:MAG: OmpH family outer membrane protein [Verrucomicrobiales bacterium]|nr:OmpH family outer membrane protein [Verrucomicrobiales bacterium]
MLGSGYAGLGQTRPALRCTGFAKVLRSLLILAFALAFTASAHAQMKVGTANLRKIFDGYYKTKQADQMLKDRGAEADKIMKGMLDDYQKASEEYKTLSAGAADQAVSSEEREKRKNAASDKLKELQEIERQVKQYRENNIRALEDQKKRMREDVLRSIRERVTVKAKAGGYNLVLDVSAETINQTDVILFSSGLTDMTDEVLSDLNANAPAALLRDERPAAEGSSGQKKNGKDGRK